MLAAEVCDPFDMIDECGVDGFDDGTCVFLLGCSVGCNFDSDCPDGSSCVNWVVSTYCEAL
jgi:hypothetical protein